MTADMVLEKLGKQIPWRYRRRARLATMRMFLGGWFRAEDTLMFTGSPRSGTTWLGQLFATIPRSVCLFEPLMLDKVPEAAAAGFEWRTYVRPDEEWPEGERFLRRVLEGRVLNHWILADIEKVRTSVFARTLIVKFVRANRMLPWIVRRFAMPAPLLILRHPCAVVASQMAEGSWNDPRRPTGGRFLEDHPHCAPLFDKVKTPEELLALTWALDNYVPLASEHSDRWQFVTYEGMRRDCMAELAPVFARWGIEVPRALEATIDKPSRTTVGTSVSGLDGWKKKLEKDQVRRILAVTRALGLDFYGEAAEPDLAMLRDPGLRQTLRQCPGDF